MRSFSRRSPPHGDSFETSCKIRRVERMQSIERCTDRTRSSHRARNRWVKAQSMPCRRCMVRQSLFLFLLLLVYTLAYINAKVTLDIRYPWTSPLFVSFFSILSHSTFLFVAKNVYDVFAFYALRRVIVTIRERFERFLQFSLKCRRSEPRAKKIFATILTTHASYPCQAKLRRSTYYR